LIDVTLLATGYYAKLTWSSKKRSCSRSKWEMCAKTCSKWKRTLWTNRWSCSWTWTS